ncbi:MAG: Spy/CpxP family protein refolding chaperone [Devosia sp.]|nr:Spy/CpxP family protein refolding chaperone [Devosia sp.]
MKYLTTTALAALLAGSLGAVALAPAAFAEGPAAPAATLPAVPAPAEEMAAAGNGPGGFGPPMGGMMGRFGMRDDAGGPQALRAGLLDFVCGDRGAEALEIAFVRINYAVKPTTDQAPLLDALKTTALADQKKVADTCQTALQDNAGTSTMLDRLQTRLTLDNARVAALTDVLPKFKAFYDSLTADQKAKLEPRQGMFGQHMGAAGMWNHQGWQHRFGPGRMGPMQQMMDGQDQPPPADNSAAPPADDSDTPASPT